MRRSPANTAWAFATAGRLDQALFVVMTDAAVLRLGEFSAQSLANTAWAFATAVWLDQGRFVAIARAAEPRLGEFIMQRSAANGLGFAFRAHERSNTA